MLSEISANWVSLTDNPGKTAHPVALLSPGEETGTPCRSRECLRQCIHLCGALHPPPCLSQGLFYPARGSVASENLWGLKRIIEGRLGLRWHGLCVRTDRYWFGRHRCRFTGKGLANSTPGWGLCREQLPLWKNGPLERHLCIKPQLRGRGTETRVWGLSCFKSVQEGTFCDSGQINFTFLFFFSPHSSY